MYSLDQVQKIGRRIQSNDQYNYYITPPIYQTQRPISQSYTYQVNDRTFTSSLPFLKLPLDMNVSTSTTTTLEDTWQNGGPTIFIQKKGDTFITKYTASGKPTYYFSEDSQSEILYDNEGKPIMTFPISLSNGIDSLLLDCKLTALSSNNNSFLVPQSVPFGFYVKTVNNGTHETSENFIDLSVYNLSPTHVDTQGNHFYEVTTFLNEINKKTISGVSDILFYFRFNVTLDETIQFQINKQNSNAVGIYGPLLTTLLTTLGFSGTETFTNNKITFQNKIKTTGYALSDSEMNNDQVYPLSIQHPINVRKQFTNTLPLSDFHLSIKNTYTFHVDIKYISNGQTKQTTPTFTVQGYIPGPPDPVTDLVVFPANTNSSDNVMVLVWTYPETNKYTTFVVQINGKDIIYLNNIYILNDIFINDINIPYNYKIPNTGNYYAYYLTSSMIQPDIPYTVSVYATAYNLSSPYSTVEFTLGSPGEPCVFVYPYTYNPSSLSSGQVLLLYIPSSTNLLPRETITYNPVVYDSMKKTEVTNFEIIYDKASKIINQDNTLKNLNNVYGFVLDKLTKGTSYIFAISATSSLNTRQPKIVKTQPTMVL